MGSLPRTSFPFPKPDMSFIVSPETETEARWSLKITPVTVFPSPEAEFLSMERILVSIPPDASIHHHHQATPSISPLSVSNSPECLSRPDPTLSRPWLISQQGSSY